MDISFDSAKRMRTLAERGLDFARAGEVLDGRQVTFADEQFDYGEVRLITFRYLDERAVVVVWTEQDDCRRIISMRKANDREKELYYEET